MNDNLQRVLDEGIASYAKDEPLAGLEDRILRRIGATGRTPSHTKGWLVTCGVGLAGIALLLLLLPGHHEQSNPLRVATIEVPPKASVPTKTVLVSVRRLHHRVGGRKALPKLAVFPTRSPLTPEERRLTALMNVDPEGTIAAFESLRKQSEPLEIKELVIEPLETGGGQ